MKHLWEVSGLFHLLKKFHLLVKNVSFVVSHLFISRTGAAIVSRTSVAAATSAGIRSSPPRQRRRRHPLASGLPLPPSVDTITQPAPSPLLPPSQILTWIGSVLFCHFMCKPRHGRSYNFDCTVDRHLLAWRICPRTHGRPISKDRCFVDLFKSCLSNKVK